VPGIKTLAKREGRETHDRDVRQFDGKLRPSTKCKFYEAGMIYTAASSFLPKGNATREVALGLCRKLGTDQEAEFVYELDSQTRVQQLGRHYPGVEGADVLHSFLGNSMRALRRLTRDKDARVIYPGRDVWAFEVMSKRNSVRSVYDSRVSREIDRHEEAFKGVVGSWDVPDWSKVLAFDSGYAGTVPRAIGRVAGQDKINIIMMSAREAEFQLFSGHTGSRAKALALEYLAKYRKRCLVRDGEPYQPLADLEEFIKAALLTIWLWHHKSPRFLPSWQEPPKPKLRAPTFKLAPTGPTAPFNQQNMFMSTNTGASITGGSIFQIATSATGVTTSNIIDMNTTMGSTATTNISWM
jgi:hypothetical protein